MQIHAVSFVRIVVFLYHKDVRASYSLIRIVIRPKSSSGDCRGVLSLEQFM